MLIAIAGAEAGRAESIHLRMWQRIKAGAASAKGPDFRGEPLFQFRSRGAVGESEDGFLGGKPRQFGLEDGEAIPDERLGFSQGQYGFVGVPVAVGLDFMAARLQFIPDLEIAFWKTGLIVVGRHVIRAMANGDDVEAGGEVVLFKNLGDLQIGFKESIIESQGHKMHVDISGKAAVIGGIISINSLALGSEGAAGRRSFHSVTLRHRGIWVDDPSASLRRTRHTNGKCTLCVRYGMGGGRYCESSWELRELADLGCFPDVSF